MSFKNFFLSILVYLKIAVLFLWEAFDIRDVLIFGGLAMLGYGLHLRCGLWLAMVTCGPVLFALGYLMRGRP